MHKRFDHDLTLPAWGPYAKDYFGVSHLADRQAGVLFNICAVPGRFRGEFFAPSTIRPSGWLPWDASAGLSRYSYRQQIVWKDEVYAQIHFEPSDEGVRMKAELVNRSDREECLCLHLCLRLNGPILPGSRESVRMMRPVLPEGACWVSGQEYEAISMVSKTPYQGLNWDAKLSGETAGHGFCDGVGLGDGFGRHPEDAVRYHVPENRPELRIRCRSTGTRAGEIAVEHNGGTTLLSVAPGAFSLAALRLPEGTREITLRCTNGEPLEIDGLAFGARDLSFEAIDPYSRPQLEKGDDALRLTYGGHCYSLSWSEPGVWVREVLADDVEQGVLRTLHDHVEDVVDAGGRGHMTDLLFAPLNVAPGGVRTLIFDIAQGESAQPNPGRKSPARSHPPPAACPEAVRFGRERLNAALLTNVVFPIRNQGRWIRHFTPGRWWDSLYTWDSGCIGLGLCTVDLQLAADNLLAYLADPENKQIAFVHHGSMVPTQFFVAWELWNRTQDRALLRTLWPRLQKYYRYFIGEAPGSTMSPFESGLLMPWDYFYNSGGWDDYPVQQFLQECPGRRRRVSPCITNAMAIRCAKMMAAFAELLGESAAPFTRYADRLTQALQAHAWDDEAGVFSYVEHNDEGRPSGVVRNEDQVNYNHGLDGLSPLLADAVTGSQADRLMDMLMDSEHFLTPMGFSAVDMNAPYYSVKGYWNGSVWMPYQWFFWKALLDYGRASQARRLAWDVLQHYGEETGRRYACWEHFVIESGRGAGWHHFSGLSSVLLNLFDSYCRPGTVTAGHNGLILEQQWDDDFHAVSIRLRYPSARKAASSLLIVLAPAVKVDVCVNGEPVEGHQPFPGCIEITRCWPKEALVSAAAG